MSQNKKSDILCDHCGYNVKERTFETYMQYSTKEIGINAMVQFRFGFCGECYRKMGDDGLKWFLVGANVFSDKVLPDSRIHTHDSLAELC